MKTMQAMEHHLVYGAALSGAFALLMLVWAWFYFTRTGRGLGSNQFLRGARFGTARQLRRLLWRTKKGSFSIGGVPVPDAFEPEHILICGAPGTGKTNIILKMLAGKLDRADLREALRAAPDADALYRVMVNDGDGG